MTVEDETRRVVESYFASWTTKYVPAAHALLAGDLEFSGPTASYQSADAFLPALAKFAEMTKWARIVDLVVEGDRAALLYDCELPQPVGKLRIASFFRVEKGKIGVNERLLDATELRQLQARQRARQLTASLPRASASQTACFIQRPPARMQPRVPPPSL